MTTILVIEDEQPLLEEIGDTLQFEGYEVHTAENGLAGVRQAQSNTPDLIVCDISMPELDGYGVLLELRKNPATVTVPFVFLTARADKSFMRHGMELGADDYITKPFTHNELLAAVRSRLQRHSALSDRYGQELEQMKSSLARMVVHELRTPLVSVQLAKDIIERQLGRLSPASTKELMDAMGLGINRLNHVVEQMVYLTQIETGLLNRQDILENGVIT
ncbi:MAG: response regulator, partial [Anaerolineae bacterium]|nr:response regulator [Anaerolineae bacterium]